MDEEQPDRDELGHFAPGNKLTPPRPKLQPGEERIPHPLMPHRDTKGRCMPGHTLRRFIAMSKLDRQRVSVKHVTPDEITYMMNLLAEIARGEREASEKQLRALQMWLDRVVGKPSEEVHVTEERVTANVNVDYSKLSLDELRQLDDLTSKIQGEEEEEEYFRREQDDDS